MLFDNDFTGWVRPNNDGKVTRNKVTDNKIGGGSSNNEFEGV